MHSIDGNGRLRQLDFARTPFTVKESNTARGRDPFESNHVELFQNVRSLAADKFAANFGSWVSPGIEDLGRNSLSS